MKTKEINELLKKEILKKGSLSDFAKNIKKSKSYVSKILNKTLLEDNGARVRILKDLGYQNAKEEIHREIFI